MSVALQVTSAASPALRSALLPLGLVAARVLPVGISLALISRGAVPVWLALSGSLAIAAGLSIGVDVTALSGAGPGVWGLMVLRELLLGAAFALASLLPFWALSFGVRAVDGPPFAPGGVLDTFYLLAAALLTLSLGGHRAFVLAIADSLREVPVGLALPAREALLGQLFALSGAALAAAVSLALPLWIAVLLLDLSLLLVGRALEAPSDLRRSALRKGLFLLLMAVLLAPIASRLPELTRAALRDARATLRQLSP